MAGMGGPEQAEREMNKAAMHAALDWVSLEPSPRHLPAS
jgi:hypothetical protein